MLYRAKLFARLELFTAEQFDFLALGGTQQRLAAAFLRGLQGLEFRFGLLQRGP